MTQTKETSRRAKLPVSRECHMIADEMLGSRGDSPFAGCPVLPSAPQNDSRHGHALVSSQPRSTSTVSVDVPHSPVGGGNGSPPRNRRFNV